MIDQVSAQARPGGPVADGPVEPAAEELTSPILDDELMSPIVVGVSRRTGSPEAVRWAAAEAHVRGTRVIAVTAWRAPRAPAAPGGRPPGLHSTAPDEPFETERLRLAELVAKSVGGDLESMGIEFILRPGSPASVLLSAAVGAQLLVLDSPRAGNLTTVGKAWIVPQILAKSPCPVVLMPPKGSR